MHDASSLLASSRIRIRAEPSGRTPRIRFEPLVGSLRVGRLGLGRIASGKRYALPDPSDWTVREVA